MEAFVLANIAQFTYLGIFAFLMLTVFGFPFPEDAVLLLSGAVASQGVINVMPAIYVAYVGVVIGDLLLYYIGRRYGTKLVCHSRFKKILTEERLARATKWFHRWGNSLVFFGRHLVGVRAQIFLCAGVLKFPAGRVVLYNCLSALLGVPLMVALGYLFGKNLPLIREKVAVGNWLLLACASGLIFAYAAYRLYKKRAARVA